MSRGHQYTCTLKCGLLSPIELCMSFTELTAKTEMVLNQSSANAWPDSELKLTNDVDGMSLEQLDRLPFGAIQLNPQGTILKYNSYESELAHVSRESVLGKNFFTQVAPCTNVQEFHGRFLAGARARTLHEKFRYRFAFLHKPVDVVITLFYSDITETIWVFVRPVESLENTSLPV
jgi:photoactive yellow protein